LVFEFYDKDNRLIKYETIMLLTSKEPVELPTIEVSVAEPDLAKSKLCKATVKISNDTLFKLGNEVKYTFSHHVGWSAGPSKVQLINPGEKMQSFLLSYEIPADCQVLSVSAGVDIRFGKFVKRIHDDKILYRGDWANAIKVN
jgi:hypothetical protein